MNALPLDTNHTPREVIDDLVANFGFRRVLLAVLTQVFKRSQPPDAGPFPRLEAQDGVDGLSDHLRKDLGLPPNANRRLDVDLISINRGFFH